VHYNLSLLSCYCEVEKNYGTYITWDINIGETYLEDGVVVLEGWRFNFWMIAMGLMRVMMQYRCHLHPLIGFQMYHIFL
jgi:hypothetical protein